MKSALRNVTSATAGQAAGDLTLLSATRLAQAIREREVSATEVAEAHLRRVEAVNSALNAVVYPLAERARAEARKADASLARGASVGPLHGVPFTVKEVLDVAGTPSTFGLEARANSLATEDDVYVARLRSAGAIVLGKTNVAQLLLYLETDNPLYGRTNNPWNLARSAGGSTGGEAAIIAAGGSPLGLGTDLGGSLRVPATSCGIASFKPTAGRTPDAGRWSIPIGQQAVASQVGLLAREVDDLCLGLNVIAARPSPDGPPVPLGDPSAVELSRLRVAYCVDDGTFAPAPAIARAVTEAARLLEEQGAKVTAWTPPDVGHAVDLFYGILSADGGNGLVRALRGSKRDPRIADIVSVAGSPLKVALLRRLLGRLGQRRLAAVLRNYGHSDTAHYWDLVEAQLAYRQRFRAALDGDRGGPFDAILCPACALPAFVHGATRDLAIAGGYTALYNVLGYPAGVVPFTRVRPGEELGRRPSKDKAEQAAYQTEQGSAGLPVGVQVVARPWQDHVALAAMAAIEAEAPSRHEHPGRPPR